MARLWLSALWKRTMKHNGRRQRQHPQNLLVTHADESVSHQASTQTAYAGPVDNSAERRAARKCRPAEPESQAVA